MATRSQSSSAGSGSVAAVAGAPTPRARPRGAAVRHIAASMPPARSATCRPADLPTVTAVTAGTALPYGAVLAGTVVHVAPATALAGG